MKIMSIPVLVLLGFAAWTLLILLISVGVYRWSCILMARASIAAGADGVMVEVHPDPEHALSDGFQSLYPPQFEQLVRELSLIAPIVGRVLPRHV